MIIPKYKILFIKISSWLNFPFGLNIFLCSIEKGIIGTYFLYICFRRVVLFMVGKSKILFLGFLFLFLGNISAFAQWRVAVAQEIGVVAGPLALFSDYGLRYNLETNTGNVGTGIGLVHYINFAYAADCNCYTVDRYFNDHFKIRSEIDYYWAELNHYGKLAEKQSLGGEQLRGMVGGTNVFEIGAHLEYWPLSIRDFTAFAYPIAPFASLGASFLGYNPRAHSTLGPLEENLFPAFEGGVNEESGNTWSITFGGGVRYKLDVSSDLVLNLQWRYYFTDYIDGLDHDQPQNKYNDMVFWLNFGYIYYLNF